MMRLPVRARRWMLPVLALALLAASGCEDDNAPTEAPQAAFLDGDGLFNTAYVTASILRYQHEAIEKARQMVEAGIPSIRETGCQGTGERLFLRDLNNPMRVEIRHGDAIDRPVEEIEIDDTPEVPYIALCSEAVRLTISGYMIVEFTSLNPLQYVLEMPMGWHYPDPADPTDVFKGLPRGMTYQLPEDFGEGAILDVTTPGSITILADPFFDLDNNGEIVAYSGAGGTIDCQLVNGSVEITGTLRIEERVQQLLLVEELDLRYAYDSGTTPPFADWPAGGYSIAALSVLPFFGASVTTPIDVSFDGFGGISFPVGDRMCDGNLLDPENGNPCEDL
jgi:hypothetical protein